MMNGKEYLESLRDGRTVFLNGDKVDDVTTHPAYRNSARSIAQLYDALHDPVTARILTAKTDEGHTTHKFLKPRRTQQSCLKQGMR
nr:4-hydroxyphenylacetate 3-hydroxylase N-terminal domain-containing protein [Peribacillus sp. BBB004]